MKTNIIITIAVILMICAIAALDPNMLGLYAREVAVTLEDQAKINDTGNPFLNGIMDIIYLLFWQWPFATLHWILKH